MLRFPSASASGRRRRHARIGCRRARVPIMCGSRATSIRWEKATNGTTAIGRGRPTPARTGLSRITGAVGTTPVIGKAVAGWSATIITGTAARNGTRTTTARACFPGSSAGLRPALLLRGPPRVLPYSSTMRSISGVEVFPSATSS